MAHRTARRAALGIASAAWLGLLAFAAAVVLFSGFNPLLMGLIVCCVVAVIASITALVVALIPPPLAAWQLGRKHPRHPPHSRSLRLVEGAADC